MNSAPQFTHAFPEANIGGRGRTISNSWISAPRSLPVIGNARDELAALGWEVKDTPQGPKVKKKG